MNTTTISLVFEDFARVAQRANFVQDEGEIAESMSKPALRIALLYREQLRFPSSSGWLLRILSGKAWLSFGGQDFSLLSGDSLAVPKVKNGAIISAMDKEILLFEIT